MASKTLLPFIVQLAKLNSTIDTLFNNGAFGPLSFNEFLILHYLSEENDGMQRIRIAQKIGLSASGVTRLLAPMEKIHLVRTDVSERDARSKLVYVTDAGIENYKRALDSLDGMSSNIFNKLSEDNLEEFTKFLQEIIIRAQVN